MIWDKCIKIENARNQSGMLTNPCHTSKQIQNDRRIKIAMYSHDTMGLGHMRRNKLIAHALTSSNFKASVLLITGAREACLFSTPAGIDYLTLPALYKEIDGQYRSKHLDISLRELIKIRSQIIYSALKAFEPDLLIVDKEPLGAVKELKEALNYLFKRGKTRIILGLRDVLDEPIVVKREWQRASHEETIRRYYDSIWVYGDPTVYDPISEYSFPPDIARKVHFTGYLDQRLWLEYLRTKDINYLENIIPPSDRYILCMVGGGQDGSRLSMAFAEAELPQTTHGVIVTGPFMSRKAQRSLLYIASFHSRLHVIEFVSDPYMLLSRAEKVIAMGGYNTTCEVLSFEKRALIVPRIKPRREQFLRAKRFKDLGILDYLHPDELTPQALTKWIMSDSRQTFQARSRINLNAKEHILCLLNELFGVPPNSN